MEYQISDRTVYWGRDYIISSLGFGTQCNVDSIDRYQTNQNEWGDTANVCLVDWQQVKLRAALCSIDNYSRAEQLALLSLQEVLHGVDIGSEKTALIVSTTKGNIELLDTEFEKCYLTHSANIIATHLGISTTPLVISNACISGVSALIYGARLIQSGRYDDVLVVGVDVLSDFIVRGFNAFKSLSTTICRPYDATRDGLTLGEGCAAVLLTSKRELSPDRVVIAGGSISNDANHISGPSRTGDGLHFAINGALEQAGFEPHDVGFVNAHGTGTDFNDQMESKALNLSELTAIPCNSLKPYIGHTLGASGVIESVLCVNQMVKGRVFGVKGYKECGTPYPLNISAEHRDVPVEVCLKTASGFGGCNAAIVLCRESVLRHSHSYSAVDIRQSAHVEIIPDDKFSFAQYIRAQYKAFGGQNLIFYKMDDLCKLGYVAAQKLLEGLRLDYPSHRIAIILANGSASLDSDIRHQTSKETSPAIFVYTLPNIVAGHIAIDQGFKGETTFFVFKDKNVTFVHDMARQLILNNKADAVVYGWCELLKEDFNAELFLIEHSKK